jgi:hypothetical protein
MTRATNARIAGFTFLAYIAAGITSTVLFRRAAGGEGYSREASPPIRRRAPSPGPPDGIERPTSS